ncbi:MAG: hypothetical protein ACRD3J_32050, partial [Thermoanaerobaculia bacterium]
MRIDDVRLELREALRRIWRFPSRATFIVLSLGVGMGGVVATVGTLDTLLLRPPPGVKDPSRIVAIGTWSNFSKATYPDYLAFQSAGGLQSVGAFATFTYTPRIGQHVVVANGMLASPTLSLVLGERVSTGRWFT